jgi:predicted phage gp36 major capsid-like protein
MVTADISQLTAECNTWRQQMRNYREEFTQLKNQLRQIARKVTQKDQLTDVDHFENQFHIQLINIHDLKHSIRNHDLKATAEKMLRNGQVSDTTWAEHEQLFDDYQRLGHMLQELKAGLRNFIAKLN